MQEVWLVTQVSECHTDTMLINMDETCKGAGPKVKAILSRRLPLI